jgi:hypothetical protein
MSAKDFGLEETAFFLTDITNFAVYVLYMHLYDTNF